MRPAATKSAQCDTASGGLFERTIYFVLVAVLCARSLIPETFEAVNFSFLAAAQTTGPTPATTAILDTILLLASASIWLRRSAHAGRNRVDALAISMLAVAVVGSCIVAADKRSALIAGSHLFAVVFAAATLVRLMRAPWMVRLLLAAVIASSCVNGFKCITQAGYEFDETLSAWQQQKVTLAASGADLTNPTIVNYERRLRSAESFGYLYHPNVTASSMMMPLLITIAICIGSLRSHQQDRFNRRLIASIAALLGAVLVIGIWLTGSAGAAGGAVVGVLLLAVLALSMQSTSIVRRAAFTWVAGAYLAVVATVAAVGLLEGTLPHASLAFRWEYWSTTAKALAHASPAQLALGIGRENFAAPYLRHKSPASTEELRNPHNLWLSLLIELGPLGLIAAALLTGSVLRRSLEDRPAQSRAPPAPSFATASWAAALGVLACHALFSATPLGAPGMLFIWSVELAAIWVLAFALASRALAWLCNDQQGVAYVRAGISAAILAALVHALIGIALFTPAGLAVFVCIAACGVALGRDAHAKREQPSSARWPRWCAITMIATLPILQVKYVTRPIVRKEALLQQMRTELASALNIDLAAAALAVGVRAAEADPWAAAPLREVAEAALNLAAIPSLSAGDRSHWTGEARRFMLHAVERNPLDVKSSRLLARSLAHDAGSLEALQSATEAFDRVVELYPSSPRDLIAAARAHLRHWRASKTTEAAIAARSCFEQAITIDDTRSPDNASKLQAQQRTAIFGALAELQNTGVATTLPSPREKP